MAATGEPRVTTVHRMEPRPWGPDRLGDVMAVVEAALPAERLTDDEVGTILFDDPDPTLVVGIDGVGVAAAVVRGSSPASLSAPSAPSGLSAPSASGRVRAQSVHAGDPVTGHVQLVAVVPEAQRAGHGGALLRAVHRWAFEDQGAAAVVAGAGAPFSLWPGVDVQAAGAQCLFESLGYEQERAYLDLTFPSRFRAPVPDGVEVRRVLGDADAEATLAFVAHHWPHWVAECRRGIEHGACHAAIAIAADDDAAPAATDAAADVDGARGTVVGFGCHSVNRLGVLGPIGTDPAWRGKGIGSALTSAIATDVMAAGIEHVQVAGIGPYRFYAKVAGATTSRAYLKLVLCPPGSPTA